VVLGYRAASYSIVPDSLGALGILVEIGCVYDSSTFPVRHDRYGIPDGLRVLHQLSTPGKKVIVEWPPVGFRGFVIARRADLQAEEGGATWTLERGGAERRVQIAHRVDQRRMLLALPAGVTRVTGLAHYDAPAIDDDRLPPGERETFSCLAQELGLRALPQEQAVQRVVQHLQGFTYSLWREAPPPAGLTPLADFVTRTKSGRYEYFAASAVLLLRAAGIPARYATGYSVMEYSPLEEVYVVRARHAHA